MQFKEIAKKNSLSLESYKNILFSTTAVAKILILPTQTTIA